MPPKAIAWVLGVLLVAAAPAWAQQGPGKPPAVGVVKAERKPVTQTHEFVGRIEAHDRVNRVARVTAFLDERLFTEGSEVKKGDLLYRLQRGPFAAEVAAKQAAVAQIAAQHKNAEAALYRAKTLLKTPAGQQSTYDAALASEQSLEAQLEAAKAELEQAQINLGYTEIRAPIDGKIGRSAVTPGNVVSPSSGTLATIVSQDPMYVVFPVSVRTALELRQRYAEAGGLDAAVVKIRLPDGRLYDQVGKLNFLDNTISGTTDTIVLRGVIPNPPLTGAKNGAAPVRALVDNELVSVVLEDAHPVTALTVPRAAVLADQRGDYVYTVDAQGKAQQQRVELGQSTPTTAVVTSGLKDGETVIVDGLQRVRPGEAVAPAPAALQPASAAPGPTHPSRS
jgi:membrane fusion protein (multidrug efflux system)